MGPTWVLSAPDGPYVSPMNLAIRGYFQYQVKSGPVLILQLPNFAAFLHKKNIHCGQATTICFGELCLIGWGNSACLTPSHYLNQSPEPNSSIFIEENIFGNILYKMSAILCRPKCIDILHKLRIWLRPGTCQGHSVENIYPYSSIVWHTYVPVQKRGTGINNFLSFGVLYTELECNHVWVGVKQVCLAIETFHFQRSALRSSDTIWRRLFWSTLAQVMARCMIAPSHYLNQCWLIISN